MTRLPISRTVSLLLPLLVPAIGWTASPPGATGRDASPTDALFRLGMVCLRHPAAVGSLTFAPEGRRLASADADGRVRVWDSTNGLLRLELPAGTGTVVVFAPDGKTLATAGRDKPLCLWDAATGKEVGRFTDVRTPVLAFAPDGKSLLTGEGSTVVRRGLPGGRVVRRFDGLEHPVSAIAFSPDGKSVAAGEDSNNPDPAILVWDASTGARHRRITEVYQFRIVGLVFAPDGKTLISATPHHTSLWDLGSGKGRFDLGLDAGGGLALDRAGKRLVTGDGVYIWDLSRRKQIQRLRRRAPLVRIVAMSPDGKRVAWVSGSTTIQLWDADSGPVHRDEVGAVAVSPDGRLVATGCGGDHAVGLWDATSGAAVHMLHFKCGFPSHWCRTMEVTSVVFSPDSRRVVTGSIRSVHLWDTATGKEVRRLVDNGREGMHFVSAVAFTPNGRLLATAGRDAAVRLWDPVRGEVLRRIYPHGERERHHGAVACLAFSPDGQTLATGSVSRLVRMAGGTHGPPAQESVQLWDVATGTKLGALRPAADAPAFVAFSPDGNLLATSATWDQPVQLWGVASRREVRRLSGYEERRHWEEHNPLAFSPDGRLLATGGKESTLVLWEVASGQVVRVLHGHTRPPRSLAFTPDGRRLVSGSADTTALMWPVATTGRPVRWTADRRTAAWRTLASNADRAYPIIWSLAAAPGEAVALLKERLHPEEEVDAGSLARLVADLGADEFAAREEAMRRLRELGARADGALRRALVGQRDLERRRRLERLRREAARRTETPEVLRDLRAVQALEQAGRPAAEALLEGLARGAESGLRTRAAQAALVRLEARRRSRRPPPASAPAGIPEGQRPRRLYAHDGEVYAIAFAPDGRSAFSAGRDGKVRRWDLGASRELSALSGHAGGTFALALAPDGKQLASGGADGWIRLWDAATGRAVRALAGHKGPVFAVAFSPDGKGLASGGADGTARLWDMATGREQRLLRTNAERVTAVIFAPDGQTLVTGGVCVTGTTVNGVLLPHFRATPVQAWSVATGKEVRHLKQAGSALALASDGRELAVVDVQSGTVLNGPPEDIFVLASGKILLIDAQTGKPRLTLEGHGGAVALSPNGALLATGQGSDLHLAGRLKVRREDGIEATRLCLWETATGPEVLRFTDEPPAVLAFAPDGRRLLAGTRTGTVYLAEAVPPGIGAMGTRLDRKTLDNLWRDLDDEAPVAYRAAAALSAAPRQAPGYLVEHLWPAPANDAGLGRLIADLSAERYVIRRSARLELARCGADAEPALRAARKRVKSARVRRWLDELLTDPGIGRFPNPLRRARAVRVLEQIGTPEARDVLKRLAASARKPN